MTEGGIVERVEPIGASYIGVPTADPTIDLGLSIWPFPVDAEHEAVLQSLGYKLKPGQGESSRQRWMHKTNGFQLFFFEAASESWSDYFINSRYLRQDAFARLAYSTRKQAWAVRWSFRSQDYEVAKKEFFCELRNEAHQWWIAEQGWMPVEFVNNELRGFKRPWYISGGWALDLYLARVRRVHEDADVVFSRTDQLALQEYLVGRGWRWLAPANGGMKPWPGRLFLGPERHQVHAHRDGAFIDFQLTEMDNVVWHYRRDGSIIRAAESVGLRTSGGIPFLAPELVLLFKSKNTSGRERGKDETDFRDILPHLELERRAWLFWALIVIDPGHPWIEQIGGRM